MSLPDGFIPVDQVQPPEPAAETTAPAADQTDWSMWMTVAEKLHELNANIVALRGTVANQAGILCAQTHLLAAMLRVLAEHLPAAEVDAVLATQVAGAAGAVDPEIAPMFNLTLAMVRLGAGLVRPEPSRVIH